MPIRVSRPSVGRIAITLVLALVVAGLMLLIACLKRSQPAGSVIAAIYESVVWGLAIVAIFVPLVALPIGRERNGARS
jgi:hypothetical protein